MSQINYKAVGDVILVKIKKVEEKTQGGIILPQEDRNKKTEASTQGVIVNIGSIAFDFLDGNAIDTPKEGDVVVFKKYSGVRISDDSELDEYRLIADRDVLGIKMGE